MNKLLTITIPVYNTEQYLRRCLDSLIVPFFMDKLEILIIIDGSPDNSIEIATEFQIKYPNTFKVIEKKNGGHGSVINKGIELASGKYFRVLDSDDWFDTCEFAKFLTAIQNIDADLVLSNFSYEFVFENRNRPFTYNNITYHKIYNVSKFVFNKQFDITIHSITYATSVLHKSKLKVFEHCFYEDTQYRLFVFPSVTLFTILDYSVYKYFIGREGQSVSNSGWIKYNTHYRKIALSCLQFINENNLLKYNLKDIWLLHKCIAIVWDYYSMIVNINTTFEAKKIIQQFNIEAKADYPDAFQTMLSLSPKINLFYKQLTIGVITFKYYKISKFYVKNLLFHCKYYCSNSKQSLSNTQ